MKRRVFLQNGLIVVAGAALTRLPLHGQEGAGTDWLVTPYTGVGPVKFGMKRRKARRVVPGKPDKRDEYDTETDDVWSELGVKLMYMPPKDNCQAILFTGAKVQPLYQNHKIMTMPARDVFDMMQAADPDLSVNGRGWTCMRQGITVTAPEWQTAPKKPASAILFFAEDFYTSFFD